MSPITCPSGECAPFDAEPDRTVAKQRPVDPANPAGDQRDVLVDVFPCPECGTPVGVEQVQKPG